MRDGMYMREAFGKAFVEEMKQLLNENRSMTVRRVEQGSAIISGYEITTVIMELAKGEQLTLSYMRKTGTNHENDSR